MAHHQGGLSGAAELQARLLRELDVSAETLRELRGESQAHLDALAARVALLQARLARLDALGGELVAMAQLEQGEREFDFASDPGLGGRAPELRQATDARRLETTLAGLLHQAEDRELQLRILKDVVRHRQLTVEAYPSGWPVRSGWISSRFGWRKDPFHGGRAFHHGLDFASRHKVLIRAAARGIVESVGRRGNYGLTVELNHGNGLPQPVRARARAAGEAGTGGGARRSDRAGRLDRPLDRAASAFRGAGERQGGRSAEVHVRPPLRRRRV